MRKIFRNKSIKSIKTLLFNFMKKITTKYLKENTRSCKY